MVRWTETTFIGCVMWLGVTNAWILLLTLPFGSEANEITIPVNRRIVANVVSTLTGSVDQPLFMPTDVAVDPAGRVFIVDGTNDRIVRFNAKGQLDGTFVKFGDHDLERPVGLTIDQAGSVWIADTGNHRLIVSSGQGRLIEVIELPSSAQGKPADPTDVAVLGNGERVFVADNDHHALIVRDGRGNAWKTLGKRGQGIGEFQWPFMVCLSESGDLFVTEAIGARVQRLTAANRWAGQIGRWGVELGQLYRPKGIAVGPRGRVYVGDSTLGVVQVFDAGGAVIGALTDDTGKLIRFDHPMGMSFGPKKRLYVVELKANRVAVVSLSGMGKPSTGNDKQGQR